VTIGVAAQGQEHRTTLAQICAAELGVPVDDVVVVADDTQRFPIGMGTGGGAASRPTPARPSPARRARSARAPRRSPPSSSSARRRTFGSRTGASSWWASPGRALALGRVAHAAIRSKVLRRTGEPGLQRCTYHDPDTVTWAFGTQGAAVEVDLETCDVRLLAYSVVHDSGRAINPAIVEEQLQGGAAQGIGAGLWEELVYDAGGQLVTGSLMDYGLPKADQLPPLAVARLDHSSAVNELGIKGVGESGAIPGAAAVANAVEDALADLGVVIREVPVTPARLHALLRDRPGRR
jgi:carbon-monoxide dehydrogenase large subunit